MRSRAVRVLGVACCLFAFGRSAAAQSASPQQGVSVTIVDSGQTPTPGPTSTPFVTCLQTRDADNHPQDTFAEREPMRVFLAAGCAESHEVDIEIDVESSPVLLTHMDADAAGGFLTDAIHLPAAVLAGPHDVVVKTIEHTYRVPITVTAAASSTGGGGHGTAQVLGSVIRRHLPHTGAEILRLVLFGIGLAVFGAGLIAVTRRRRTAS